MTGKEAVGRKLGKCRISEEKVIQGGEYAPLCQMLLTR